jgi:hypothetical protein
MGRVAARTAQVRSVLGAIIGVDAAWEGERRPRRQGGEQGVQQQGVERGNANRDTLSRRTLLQSPYLHAYAGPFLELRPSAEYWSE